MRGVYMRFWRATFASCKFFISHNRVERAGGEANGASDTGGVLEIGETIA
jgi:hypothetical protein